MNYKIRLCPPNAMFYPESGIWHPVSLGILTSVFRLLHSALQDNEIMSNEMMRALCFSTSVFANLSTVTSVKVEASADKFSIFHFTFYIFWFKFTPVLTTTPLFLLYLSREKDKMKGESLKWRG